MLLTKEMVLNAIAAIQNRKPEKYLEVYPQQYKNIPEIAEICGYRVKNGLGVWSEPIPTESPTPEGENETR